MLEELAYPGEVIAFIFRKLLNLGFLVLFWFVIASTNPDIFTFTQMISYFLISGAVQDLTLTTGGRFGRDVQKLIKDGTLSNYLVKPIPVLRYCYVAFMGQRAYVAAISLVFLIIGIFMSPPKDLAALILFPISLVLTTIAGAGVNVFLATVGFYTPEAGSIKNVYEHINKILSGALVPLDYFPSFVKSFALLTPSPVLVYFPTSILQNGGFNSDTFAKLGLSAFWAVFLLITSNIVWKKALKNYDGVGI